MTETILLYGGAFDPPHKGHAKVAESALDFLPTCSELWFLPSFSDAFGKKKMQSAEHRVKMLKLLLADLGNKRLKICTYEIDTANNAGTYSVIKGLMRKYPDKEFIYVIGKDQAYSIKDWRNSRKLRMTTRFLIVNREGVKQFFSNRWWQKKHHFYLTKSPVKIIISSTEIRENFESGYGITNKQHPYLCEPVYKYIVDNGLYREF